MKYTISDVAKKAGVSISTVSRYMADHTSVNTMSAVKVSKAIEELGFIPNSFARNLKRGSSNIVGFVSPDISQDLFNRVAKALNKIFYEYDYMLITCDSDSNPSKEQRLVNSLLQQNAALIIVASCGNNAAFLDEVSRSTNKILLFDRLEESVMADCICEDNELNAYELTKLTLERGFTRYAVLVGVSFSAVTRYRLRGIRRALDEAGVALPDDRVVMDCTTTEKSRDSTRALLTAAKPPEIILFTNPKCINGLFQACWMTGMELNRDIFAAGFASRSTKSTHNVSIPCVIQDSYQLGMIIGKYAIKRLKKPPAKPSNKVIWVESRIVQEDAGFEVS